MKIQNYFICVAVLFVGSCGAMEKNERPKKNPVAIMMKAAVKRFQDMKIERNELRKLVDELEEKLVTLKDDLDLELYARECVLQAKEVGFRRKQRELSERERKVERGEARLWAAFDGDDDSIYKILNQILKKKNKKLVWCHRQAIERRNGTKRKNVVLRERLKKVGKRSRRVRSKSFCCSSMYDYFSRRNE